MHRESCGDTTGETAFIASSTAAAFFDEPRFRHRLTSFSRRLELRRPQRSQNGAFERDESVLEHRHWTDWGLTACLKAASVKLRASSEALDSVNFGKADRR